MKTIKEYIIEGRTKKPAPKKDYPYKKAETYGKLGEKWFEKCKDFATAGSTSWAKYGINDFDGFLEDMDKEFKPEGNTCKTRWEICQAIKDGDIAKAAKIAKDNNIDKFAYGAFMSESVYGSYFLDTYMLLRTYEYVVDGNMIIRNGILNSIWAIDDKFDWYDRFEEYVKQLEKKVPGHK